MLAIEKLKFTIPRGHIIDWAKGRLKENKSEEVNKVCEALIVACHVTTDAFVIISLAQLVDLGVDFKLAKESQAEPGLFDKIGDGDGARAKAH